MYVIFQFFILLITIKRFSYSVPQKLLVTVYYESLCPDSKAFILKQLEPAFHTLHEHIQLNFIPFGKSRSINYGDDGFECQHGSGECQGNIVQDCSLHYMKGETDKKILEYVACEMDTEAGSFGRFDCVDKAQLSSQQIEQCVLNGEGTILQLESEYRTSLLSPKFIPTITINDVFDQQIQNNAQVDLLGTLCALLVETRPCARHYNHLALNHLLQVPD